MVKARVRKPGSTRRAILGFVKSVEWFEQIGRIPTDREWSAISARRSGNHFLFVVSSTGVVCTPGCPARTPGRARVRIVSSLTEARAAGARACLRCRPDLMFSGGSETPASEPVDAVRHAVDRLAVTIENGDEPPTDRDLAAELFMPERRLRDIFRRRLGVTPRAWAAARRSELLRSRLADGPDVTAAVYEAGYGSSSAAYVAADRALGMTPGKFRAGGAGETISWTIAPIPDGLALVAATLRGLCSVRMGRAEDDLENELRTEFPRANLRRDESALAGVAALVSDLAAGRPRPDAAALPLDVHTTAFRSRVWEALRRIPAGETRSYGQIAEAVGAPRAARAVGSACALNPVPIVVPCHRVVASDGSIGGYSGGLARKRQLLDAEGAGVKP
jgi:AraC family transcriptional regulator of adaptative response/methylated-DNA-[protein]-cysteine methyltransferase